MKTEFGLSRRVDIFINGYVVALLALAAWLWSGMRIAYMPYFSAAMLVLLAVVMHSSVSLHRNGKLHQIITRMDPLVPIGILFLVYLGIQAWNGGRVAYFDIGYQRWVYAPPPHPQWPSSYNRAEAFRVMQWFWVAWGLAVTLRFLMRNGKSVYLKRSVIALLFNAGALALFGLFRHFARSMSDMDLFSGPGFGSFVYVNHAAAYFVMMAAVAAGCLLRGVLQSKKGLHHKKWLGAYGVLTFLCVVGANFSFSRAGIILSWSLTALGAIYGLCKSWKLLKPASRVNMVAATLATVAVFYFFISGFGSDDIRRRFSVRRPPETALIPQLARVNLDLGMRQTLWRAGWDVFQQHRLYGTGGWGYRYAVATVVDSDSLRRVVRERGRANVHNDPLQFLAEFGLVGSGIMLLGLGVLLVPLITHKIWRDPFTTFVGVGLLLVYIFSIIDLPFRNPAILWMWTSLLAVLPRQVDPVKR